MIWSLATGQALRGDRMVTGTYRLSMEHLGLSPATCRMLEHVAWRLGADVVVVIFGAWLIRRIAHVVPRTLERSGVDRTLVVFVRHTLKGILATLLLGVVLTVAGVPTATFAAALGAAGLAVGLALNSSLSNLAWGVLLIVFRPFRVGDHILVANLEGRVESITLMHTCVITLDHRFAVLPNAKVGSETIVNVTRLGTRRFDLHVGIAYHDDISFAMDVVMGLLRADTRVLAEPSPGIWVENLGSSSVDLVIRGSVAAGDWLGVRSDLLRQIKEQFIASGITVPFPQREIVLRKASLSAYARYDDGLQGASRQTTPAGPVTFTAAPR